MKACALNRQLKSAIQLAFGPVNLGFQIIILSLVLIGFFLKSKRRNYLHGVFMFVAVILNIVSFALVMGPSILGFEVIVVQPLSNISVIAVVHGVIGGIALISGVVLAFSWRLQRSVKNCLKRKKIMKPTIILWILALMFGIWLYIILYRV
jgi:hypothetical protein